MENRSNESFLRRYPTFTTPLVNDEPVSSSPGIVEELYTLFDNFKVEGTVSSNSAAPYEDVRKEFARNGSDSEYCPDLTASINQTKWPNVLQKPFKIKRAKNLVGERTYCILCKNNGEDAKYYRSHILKDHNGRVVCPILRAYICPICNATGDYAHTKRYCPQKQMDDCQWMSMIKTFRTSTGKRKCHVPNVLHRPVPRPLFKTNN